MLCRSPKNDSNKLDSCKPSPETFQSMDISSFPRYLKNPSSSTSSSLTGENQIHISSTVKNYSSLSIDELRSTTPNLSEDTLTIEEIDPKEHNDILSYVVVHPYEIEDGDSECSSISSSSSSCVASFFDVNTSCKSNDSTFIDPGNRGKTGSIHKPPHRSSRCEKKRTLSKSFGSDFDFDRKILQ
ncbi:hypothetical protein EV44_g3133 [Erysiphe necator]|uniref:Uncharacterized protein n=1 Tax=Uncinula necator TaxID=52586 RepID=A0A0B1P273_UNCNE|nr:hypothetical protein EV44_g3133 [Erysiphe necator]